VCILLCGKTDERTSVIEQTINNDVGSSKQRSSAVGLDSFQFGSRYLILFAMSVNMSYVEIPAR